MTDRKTAVMMQGVFGRGSPTCLVATATLCVVGCGDANGRPDGDRDGGHVAGSLLPDLRPCPAGWREVGEAPGAVTCDPWPATGRAVCAADEAHFPGAPGCERVGPACPAGPFPDDLPVDAPVTYVSAGASGGDGTLASPFGSLYDATAGASDGVTVAMARGTYYDAARLVTGVTLRGACVADTVIVAGDILAAGGIIRDLRMVDSDGTAINIGGPTGIENVVIEGGHFGLNLTGGGVIAGGLVIRGVTTGVQAFTAGVELRRTSIEGASEHGVFIGESGGQPSVVEDTAITGVNAMALSAWVADAVTVRRSVVEDAGLAVVVGESRVQLEQSVIRRGFTAPGSDNGGFGVVIVDDEPSSMQRMLLEDLRLVAVHVTNTRLTIVDSVIRDVRPDSCGETTCVGEAGGTGVVALANATADLSHFQVDGAALCGLHVAPDGEVDAADGEVSRCAIGACIQAVGFDTSRVSERVRYRDNGINLDTVDLPVPDPLSSLAGA